MKYLISLNTSVGIFSHLNFAKAEIHVQLSFNTFSVSPISMKIDLVFSTVSWCSCSLHFFYSGQITQVGAFSGTDVCCLQGFEWGCGHKKGIDKGH